jgi:hypothetical protein
MIKKILFAVIFIILLIASNLLGGFIGFEKGYETALYVESLSDIQMSIIMLKELHKDKTERSISVMESKLDQQIYFVGTYKDANDSIYNYHKYDGSAVDITEAEKGFMNRAIKYRREFPSSSTVPEFKKMVDEILKKYEKR